MNSSTDGTEESPIRRVQTDVEKCDQLLEEYYELARERAALETKGVDAESNAGGRYAEVMAEMDVLETEIATLLDSFDENDYAALFKEGEE